MDTEKLNQLLTVAVHNKASDVHIQVGEPPLLRINGYLAQVKYHAIEPDEMLVHGRWAAAAT